ncbi:MFS transporter [Lentzea sp. NEAU-D7]|uniref:MFS transporter n=1 Tax=Lentzea sp. NEAU-D7 TaxID=2994667 RepID=UPI00224A5F06|nr:MFS transporter [Lentzea sp. NEAU-D7]MCX2954746.1 MFS transporter [Lentzea sp. NEAU-D7]
MDSRGPGVVLLTSNVVRAVTFTLYPFTGEIWHVAVLAASTSAADRMFWTSNAPLLGLVAKGRELDDLLGTQSVVRVVGLGVGAALATPLSGSVTGLHLFSYFNAATFALTAVVLFPIVRGLGRLPGDRRRTVDAAPVGWATVLRDRPCMALCLIQAILSLLTSSLVVIFPLVSVTELKGPVWLAGTSVVIGNVVLAIVQKPVLRLAQRTSRGGVVACAGAVFCAGFLLMLAGPPLGPSFAVGIVMATSVIGVIGETMSVPLVVAAANQSAPETAKGRYSALLQTIWGAAGACSPAIMSGLLTAGYAVLWSILAGLALLTVPLVLLARRKLPALGVPAT